MRNRVGIVLMASVVFLSGCQETVKRVEVSAKATATTVISARPYDSATPKPSSTPTANPLLLDRIESFQMEARDIRWIWGLSEGQFRLLKTQDGGRHWQSVISNDEALQLSAALKSGPNVFFPMSKNIIVSWTEEDGIHLLRSDDDGFQWKASLIPDQDVAEQMAFIGSKYGWILTTGMDAALGHTQKKIYRTANNGQTWTIVSSDTGYIPEDHSTSNALPQFGSTTGMTFVDDKRGWITMDNSMEAAVRLYKTMDSGRNWHMEKLMLPNGIEDNTSYSIPAKPQFFGPDEQLGMIVVAFRHDDLIRYAKYETQDGGLTWTSFVMLDGLESEIDKQEVAFTSMLEGMAMTGGKLWKTNDGGHHWTQAKLTESLNQILTDYPIVQKMQVVDSQNGWLLIRSEDGDRSDLFCTQDGGVSWTEIQTI